MPMPPDASDIAFERRLRRRKRTDRFATAVLALAAATAVASLVGVLGYVVIRGLPAWNLAFFTQIPAAPGTPGGGVGNALLGTAMLVVLALVLGAPLGLLCGVYLSECGQGSRLADVVRVVSDVLAGVPTIVVGIVVYALLVVPMRGYSALSGGVALALILLPTVVRVSEDMLRLVPSELREAGLALGVPEWRVVLTVTLRSALPGILTGAALGVARVAGETAPLLFTAFGNPYWSADPLAPVSALPLQLFLYATAPYEDLHRKAWGMALLLVLFVATASGVARLLTSRTEAMKRGIARG